MSRATPTAGDIVHDTITNELFDVEQTASGEEFAELVASHDEARVLPDRGPADHLERLGELGPAAELTAGAIVTSRSQEESRTALVIKWAQGSGLDSRFALHREGEETMPCRICESSTVGYYGHLDACVCAECGARWGEATKTERSFRLAAEGDTVTLSTPTLERSVPVEYASADGTSLGLALDGGRITLGVGPDGRAVAEDVTGTDAVTEATTAIVVTHPEDPWSE